MDFHRNSFLILLLALTSLAARAEVPSGIQDEYTPWIHQTFANPDCASSGTCSLRQFEVQVDRAKFTFGDGAYSLGSSMVARYRTDSTRTLRDYIIVQFIRGCLFSSTVGQDGRVERHFNMGRDHYGKSVDFHHPEWVIDSIEAEPGYWSTPSENLDRHYFYLWNKKKGSTDERSAVLFGKKAPPTPELYVTDFPSGASSGPRTSPRSVTNSSLEFSTCIYRTADVPPTTPMTGAGLPKAIHCVRWSSSHIFDHTQDRFESPEGIDPFCLQPLRN
jgi:hypothetical protein